MLKHSKKEADSNSDVFFFHHKIADCTQHAAPHRAVPAKLTALIPKVAA
jgi:hypothetical protein